MRVLVTERLEKGVAAFNCNVGQLRSLLQIRLGSKRIHPQRWVNNVQGVCRQQLDAFPLRSAELHGQSGQGGPGCKKMRVLTLQTQATSMFQDQPGA